MGVSLSSHKSEDTFGFWPNDTSVTEFERVNTSFSSHHGRRVRCRAAQDSARDAYNRRVDISYLAVDDPAAGGSAQCVLSLVLDEAFPAVAHLYQLLQRWYVGSYSTSTGVRLLTRLVLCRRRSSVSIQHVDAIVSYWR